MLINDPLLIAILKHMVIIEKKRKALLELPRNNKVCGVTQASESHWQMEFIEFRASSRWSLQCSAHCNGLDFLLQPFCEHNTVKKHFYIIQDKSYFIASLDSLPEVTFNVKVSCDTAEHVPAGYLRNMNCWQTLHHAKLQRVTLHYNLHGSTRVTSDPAYDIGEN